ncbi:diguanylate cyclase domain-containing protein [Cryptosporangium arvum]|uniref:diguanylate cyclase domain-containing protein n=1 Tax=Cryptosporangium arvum TaxID=80871 RepID=UPI00316AEB06
MVRLGDVVARYGGEEFAAVLTPTDPEHLHAVAERIRKSICDARSRSTTPGQRPDAPTVHVRRRRIVVPGQGGRAEPGERRPDRGAELTLQRSPSWSRTVAARRASPAPRWRC